MARLSSFIVLLLFAATGQAAPAGHAPTTILAAPFSIGTNGLPHLPTMSGPSGPLTMTELGGNVVACSSQVTFHLSSTAYLDCLEPVSTMTVGTSSASALQLVQLTVSAGLTLEGLPLVYAHKTDTVTLLPFSTGQDSWASSATRTRRSASSSTSSSSPSKSKKPRGNTSSSVLSSSTSRSRHKEESSHSSRQSLTPSVTQTRASSASSGRSSSTLQPGRRGHASLSTGSSASSSPTHGHGAASAPSSSHISSADSHSKHQPTTQATSSDSSTGRSRSKASGNVPSVTPGPSTYSIDGVGFTGNPSSLVAGHTTLTPGGAPLITSGHTFSIPVSATGRQINVDGTLTTLHSLLNPTPSTYSIDGVSFTGNPSSLVAGHTTLTPGGAPLITSGHTFSIPVSATGRQINVDGTLTTLHGLRTHSGSSSAHGSRISTTKGASLTSNSAASSDSQTPTVTSTETAAPPGASAETLVSGAFLFNQWITTTKPGSSTPTVIPIILPPGGGSPIALWGFLPGPPPGGDLPNPPALEINIPKLKIPCVKLFGLKFGDCSSDDGNDHKPTNNPTDTKPTHTKPSNTRSTTATTKSQSSSKTRSSSSSRSQSCSDVTATITHVSCATAGTSTSCTTHFNTNVGCSASGLATTSGSCIAKTTIGSSTACCSSVTVSSGSTVCAFADLTQWDMNSPPSDLQTAPPAAQLASEFSAFLLTHSGLSGGVGGGTAASATGSVSSKRHASSTRPASVSATSSAVNHHKSSSSAGLTTSGSSSKASPAPTKTDSSSSTPKPTAIYTYTDPVHGYVVACDSTYTSEVAGYVLTECTGSLSTISTDTSIISFNSVYGIAQSSSSAASAASAASVSSAAAVPTARILITYYTYEDDNVYIYQYRAYDGVPTEEIPYCSTASPISFANLPNGNGDPSDLPTNQLPKFTTHGIKDCTYSSPSSSKAGTVSCPGWANPVQCISIVGSGAKEYQCPTAQGGTEQQPILVCDWGAHP